MKKKELVRKDRIIEYLHNIERQVEDILSIPVSDKGFFLNKANSRWSRSTFSPRRRSRSFAGDPQDS